MRESWPAPGPLGYSSSTIVVGQSPLRVSYPKARLTAGLRVSGTRGPDSNRRLGPGALYLAGGSSSRLSARCALARAARVAGEPK